MATRDPSELPPEDQPDHECEQFMRSMGLMHYTEVLQAEGDFNRIAERTIEEWRVELRAAATQLVNSSKDEIRSMLESISYRHLAAFHERLAEAGLPIPNDPDGPR